MNFGLNYSILIGNNPYEEVHITSDGHNIGMRLVTFSRALLAVEDTILGAAMSRED